MGRMHSKGKGMSSSALPYKRSSPSWSKTTPTEVRARPLPRTQPVAVIRTLQFIFHFHDSSLSMPHILSFTVVAPPPPPPEPRNPSSSPPYTLHGASCVLYIITYVSTTGRRRKIKTLTNFYLQQVVELMTKAARKGATPSQIGVLLRDQHGITQVKAVNGSSILRILKGLGLAPEIPEDLYHLIKKAVSMRKHLELNRKDRDGKFRLILVESRIHRLARYYRVSGLSSLYFLSSCGQIS